MSDYDLNAAGFIALAVQVVIPLLVAVVTREVDHPRVNAVALLGLTALTQVLTELAVAGVGSVDPGRLVFNAAVGLAISISAHFGLWKPTGVSSQAGKLGRN